MSSLISIGAAVVIAASTLSMLSGVALPRELMAGALMAIGLPLIVGNATAGRVLGALCAGWVACRMWMHAPSAGDPRAAVLLYLLALMMLATAVAFICRTEN